MCGRVCACAWQVASVATAREHFCKLTHEMVGTSWRSDRGTGALASSRLIDALRAAFARVRLRVCSFAGVVGVLHSGFKSRDRHIENREQAS